MLLLLACAGKDTDTDPPLETLTETTDSDSTTVPPEDLGDPYLALVTPVPHGILSSDCEVTVEVKQGETTDQILTLSPARGGEWVGGDLEGEVLYKAIGWHSTCTTQTPEEQLESGSFSGVAGLLFVYWFNGTNAGFDDLKQTEDFSGGSVTLLLEAGTDPAEITAIATELGATVAAGDTADTYVVSFPTELPIGLVLSRMTEAVGYIEGTPDWIIQPNWW